MSGEIGFLRRALSIFEKYNVSIEHVPSGIDSFSVVVPYGDVERCQYELVTELKKELDANVTIDPNIALVAVVGRNMAKRSGVCATIFQALGEQKINVRLLAQGPSELNIIIGIASEDYERTIQSLYKGLIA